MKSHIRAAAEFLLKSDRQCGCDPETGAVPCLDCAIRDLATQWLAEHPAEDDLPATEEWLAEVGFRPLPDEPGWLRYGRVLLIQDSQKVDTAWVRPCAVYQLDTRGDIRRLCAGLKQELPTR